MSGPSITYMAPKSGIEPKSDVAETPVLPLNYFGTSLFYLPFFIVLFLPFMPGWLLEVVWAGGVLALTTGGRLTRRTFLCIHSHNYLPLLIVFCAFPATVLVGFVEPPLVTVHTAFPAIENLLSTTYLIV